MPLLLLVSACAAPAERSASDSQSAPEDVVAEPVEDTPPAPEDTGPPPAADDTGPPPPLEPPQDLCAGKCGQAYKPSYPCQCNDLCGKYGNCCEDYADACSGDIDLDWVLAPQGQCDLEEGEWEVLAGIADGDTVWIMRDGAPLKIRLLIANTPEDGSFGTPVECFNQEASAYSKERLDYRNVCLIRDPDHPDMDKNGRLLRHLYYEEPEAGGKLVNHAARLVRLGFAHVGYKFLTPQTMHSEAFVFQEQKAKSEGAGGWTACAW